MNNIADVLSVNRFFVFQNLIVFSRNLICGSLATLCLLYAMQLLVDQDFPDTVEEPRKPIPPIVMDIPEDIPVIYEQSPIRPVEIKPPTKVEIEREIINPITDETVIHIGPIVSANPPESVLPLVDGQMMPFVKVAPAYPANAAIKGIEGYVDVMFDVTEIGTTTNIRVVGYSPSTIFNKSVIKSIKGWKYKPNIVDGVAVKTFDIKERIRFNLEK